MNEEKNEDNILHLFVIFLTSKTPPKKVNVGERSR